MKQTSQFGTIISSRNVHPYQTTVVPRSEQQFATASRLRAKFPWAEDVNTPAVGQTTDRSTPEHLYHVPQYKETGLPSPVYHTPYGTGMWSNIRRGDMMLPTSTYTFPTCASSFSLHPQELNQVMEQIPSLPSASPEVPIIGACGGHCPGFEYVCYYILQVIFVVGILTGISLCIAGIVLRRTNRNGDLGVLVYIGCLSSCVCGVLLGVQCCVRREIRQRKLRTNMHIPMQSIQEVPAPAFPLIPSTIPRSQIYRPTTSSISQEDEILGVPWWRRTNRD
ncbi:uncharacterized protein LOC125049727 isoform X2 [Pieris napi]|uniref:uncharacterized protein LOC125049727 isoform X2 n=1 Tax=Pieris napi TaxID=78633 RepID=UPI001FBB9CAF|nr:uncharacterized protein LOC125049727 isoform X2 [Pieris napi]